MSREQRTTARGRDGVQLLAQLRAERDVPRCGLCEVELDVAQPLCRPCDRLLGRELGLGRRGRS